jgi:5S rRNA maturation endonuclease (ribonuclease M5)
LSDTYEDIKNKANMVRHIDLNEVLIRTGAIKDNIDKAKWRTCQGVISVTGQKFINWSDGGVGGGGAIDLIIHLKQFDFKTAVSWLFDNFSSSGNHISNNIKPAIQPALRLPKRDEKKLARITHYLKYDRYLPLDLINLLAKSGKLYADKRANAVFLLLGKEKTVVGAELRGTTTKRWRGMATGSRKDLGCFYIKRSHTNKMVLCESAIDALSCFALNRDFITLSTSGANPNPAWLTTFINKGFEIYCGFDADETGDSLADKMMRRYPSIKRLRPSKHDWNEILQSKYHTC